MYIKSDKKYYVQGGLFVDTSFTSLCGDKIKLGPFNHVDALKTWQVLSFENIDTCNFKLTIVKEA